MADQSSHSLTHRCYAKKNDEDVARTDTSRRRTYLVRLSEQSERARAGETVEAEKSQMDGCSKGLFWFPRSLLAPSLLPSSHHIMRTPSFSPASLSPSLPLSILPFLFLPPIAAYNGEGNPPGCTGSLAACLFACCPILLLGEERVNA